jgi:hypothetical protein
MSNGRGAATSAPGPIAGRVQRPTIRLAPAGHDCTGGSRR